MSNMEARSFLDSVAGYVGAGQGGSIANPVRLATIDSYYTYGQPRVTFDGEASTTSKGYAWVYGYTPSAGDRVYMVPVGQTYVIAGKIQTTLTYNQYVAFDLVNGWRAYDTNTYHGPSVTKTPSGLVSLSGLISSGTASVGTTVGYLPLPFRPINDISFAVLGNGAAVGVDVIASTGAVVIGYGATNVWVSLNNITFNNGSGSGRAAVSWYSGWSDGDTDNPVLTYKDALGRVWFSGSDKYSGTPTAETPMFQVNAAHRPSKQMHFPGYGASTWTNFDAKSTGDIDYKTNGGSASFLKMGNLMYDEASVGGWTNASYLNGWVSANSAAQPDASYLKDSEGIVHIRGLVKSGTIGSTIFTLPSGMRPRKTIVRICNSGNNAGRVDIKSDGSVVATSGTNAWFSLDGILFNAEQ